MLKKEVFDKLINVPVDFSGIAIGNTYYIIKSVNETVCIDNDEIYGINHSENIVFKRTFNFNVDIEILHIDTELSNKNYGR